MSVAGISQDHPDRNILMKKSFHRRNDSGELDVFEAARYFSGYGESALSFNHGSSFNHHHHHHHQKMMKEDNRSWRGGRISLDMPIRHNALDPQNQPLHHSQVVTLDHIKDKKYKQPSSPGGRLASFLNALFSQSASKKKKSKPSSAVKDDINHDDRRKRRTSMSHFRSSSTAHITTTTTTTISVDSKSIYSSSSSGFRTPPAYAQTPSKSYAELKSFAAKKSNPSPVAAANTDNDENENENENGQKDLGSSEEKNTDSEEKKLGWSVRSFDEERGREENGFNVDDDDGDDGAESDSSSDLFELQNYDLGSCYSSGLPVYETTNMDKIKRGSAAPISSAASTC